MATTNPWLAGQIRQHFYKITLPWSDEGFRLLPANFYFDLMARMREFEAGFEQGVESFLGVYPQYIEQVKPELNGLFREEDYPTVEKLRKKFGVKLEVLPIPSGADFRVQMSAEEQARVSREIDANVRESLMRGTEDLWKRLREVVAHMVDRLNEPESRFHGSLVTNVLDLVEILPRLNVNGDTDLNRFADQVKERLASRHSTPKRTNSGVWVMAVSRAAASRIAITRISVGIRSRYAIALPTEVSLMALPRAVAMAICAEGSVGSGAAVGFRRISSIEGNWRNSRMNATSSEAAAGPTVPSRSCASNSLAPERNCVF
jgi:hypothetical protein